MSACEHRRDGIRGAPFVYCGERARLIVEIADGAIEVPMCERHGYETYEALSYDCEGVPPVSYRWIEG